MTYLNANKWDISVLSDTLSRTYTTAKILAEVSRERDAQFAKWGEQNHPDGGTPYNDLLACLHKERNDERTTNGTLTWDGILLEEVHEALAENDLELRRTELIQVAAVAVAWVEALDRRTAS